MKLSGIICTQAIIPELKGTEKVDVLKEMTAALAAAGKISSSAKKKVLTALVDREDLGSTGIGKGIGVPHARHASVKALVGAFGRSRKGISWAALDGQPVDLVFLLLCDKDSSGEHLEALALIAKLVRDDVFCRFLRQADGRKDMEDLVKEADDRLAGEDA